MGAGIRQKGAILLRLFKNQTCQTTISFSLNPHTHTALVQARPKAHRGVAFTLVHDCHACNCYYRFQLRGDLFLAISVTGTDRSERNLGTRGFIQHVTLVLRNIALYQKIKSSGTCHWLIMLSIELSPFRRPSSRAKTTDAIRDFGCDP